MDPRLARGAEAFNAGDFFAAHEIWEELWDESVGTEKRLLQALVQIAAGYAKLESGVRGGALKLLARGLERLRTALSVPCGLQLAPFVEAVAADLARVRSAPESAGLESVCPPALDLE
jgi:uncharacterized protein